MCQDSVSSNGGTGKLCLFDQLWGFYSTWSWSQTQRDQLSTRWQTTARLRLRECLHLKGGEVRAVEVHSAGDP